MFKNYFQLIVLLPILAIAIYKISFARKSFAPAQNTGAPQEATCGFSNSTNSCHGSIGNNGEPISDLLPLNTDLVLQINDVDANSSFKYQPDEIYQLRFKIQNATASNGFSLTAKNNQNLASGTLSTLAGSDAEVSQNNSEYVGHKNTLGVSEWEFLWVAPAKGTGDVTFFAAANRSNNNNSFSGDEIIPFRLEISELTTTDISFFEDISKDVKLKSNPILNNSIELELDVKEAKKYTITILDIKGKIVHENKYTLHSGLKNISISLEQKGMFFIKILSNKNEYSTLKILN